MIIVLNEDNLKIRRIYDVIANHVSKEVIPELDYRRYITLRKFSEEQLIGRIKEPLVNRWNDSIEYLLADGYKFNLKKYNSKLIPIIPNYCQEHVLKNEKLLVSDEFSLDSMDSIACLYNNGIDINSHDLLLLYNKYSFLPKYYSLFYFLSNKELQDILLDLVIKDVPYSSEERVHILESYKKFIFKSNSKMNSSYMSRIADKISHHLYLLNTKKALKKDFVESFLVKKIERSFPKLYRELLDYNNKFIDYEKSWPWIVGSFMFLMFFVGLFIYLYKTFFIVKYYKKSDQSNHFCLKELDGRNYTTIDKFFKNSSDKPLFLEEYSYENIKNYLESNKNIKKKLVKSYININECNTLEEYYLNQIFKNGMFDTLHNILAYKLSCSFLLQYLLKKDIIVINLYDKEYNKDSIHDFSRRNHQYNLVYISNIIYDLDYPIYSLRLKDLKSVVLHILELIELNEENNENLKNYKNHLNKNLEKINTDYKPLIDVFELYFFNVF